MSSSPASVAGADGGGGGAPGQFLAGRVARWIGGVAQKASAAISKVAAGPSAKSLCTEVEGRAAGGAGGRPALLRDWAKLLTAPDDTPRYEGLDAGNPLTFRAAFLSSQAWEILLATMAQELPVDPKPKTPDDASLRGFLRAAAVAGGEELALQLPSLLAETRRFPNCRVQVERLSAVLKADAQHEALRSQCTVAGTRAEEIRSGLRRAAAAQGAATASEAALDEQCRSSGEAVRLYGAFRSNLASSAGHLRGVLGQHVAALSAAGEQLRGLMAGCEQQKAAAAASRQKAAHEKEEFVAVPRRRLEELERDGQRLAVDSQSQNLEQRRKQLKMEVESVSQALAAKRQEHQTLQHHREQALAEHRHKAQAIERELQELRPSKFHGAVTPRAAHMTEGEVVASLARSADAIRGLAAGLAAAATQRDAGRAGALELQHQTIEQQCQTSLRQHAKLELARLEAAGTAVADAVKVLLEVAQSRAELAAMGVDPEDEEEYGLSSVPTKKDVKRLRGALQDAKEAWEEAVDFWFGAGRSDDEIQAVDALLSALGATGLAEEVTADLVAARGRISQALLPLRRADAALYDFAVLGGGGGADDDLVGQAEAEDLPPEAATLPHGWEAHVAETGHIYYHNLVSQETQWDVPCHDAAVAAGWKLFQAEGGNWFYHNPHDGSGVWWPELPKSPAKSISLESSAAAAS